MVSPCALNVRGLHTCLRKYNTPLIHGVLRDVLPDLLVDNHDSNDQSLRTNNKRDHSDHDVLVEAEGNHETNDQ